jgi:hypothetical protein
MAIEDWPREARGFLPPWFDLEPYEAARNWSPRCWLHEIDIRGWTVTGLSSEYMDGYFEKRLNALTKSNCCILDEEVSENREQSQSVFGVIKTPNVLSLAALYHSLHHSEKFEPYKTFFEQSGRGRNDGNLSLPYDAVIRDFSDMRYVSVDFSIPNHVLVNAFKIWLEQERKRLNRPNPKPIVYSRRKKSIPSNKARQGEKRMLSKSDFEKWVDWRILPYLDILTWLNTEGEHEEPSPRIWESILFPPHKDNSKQPPISDLKRLADWLLSGEAYGLLRSAELPSVAK